MAGIGKTTLAARLAQQIAVSPDRIFWHQFHEGEGIETIIWRLAGMLWRHGQPSLWELLEGARQSGGQPPPAEVLLDYLMQLLRGQNYVLCLDDFHHAEEDPLVEKAVDRLQTLLAAGEVNLIVTSRRMPTALRTLSFVPLGGLGLADSGRPADRAESDPGARTAGRASPADRRQRRIADAGGPCPAAQPAAQPGREAPGRRG